MGAQRAADYVNGAYPHTIGVSQATGAPRPAPGLSASRPAPPRPLLTGTRPAPSAPKPDPADLKPRTKPQGPSDAAAPERKDSLQPPRTEDRDRERSRERERERERERDRDREQQRQRAQREQEREKEQQESERGQQGEDQRPVLATTKSAPAGTSPVTQPAAPVANAQPTVKPLQTAKKLPQAGGIAAVVDGDDGKAAGSGGVAAAAAALEKPKPKEIEKRISTMTEAQIMEKMRSVVDLGDPKLLYSKIKKIGQGCVTHSIPAWFTLMDGIFLQRLWACLCRQDACNREEGCDQGDGSHDPAAQGTHRE